MRSMFVKLLLYFLLIIALVAIAVVALISLRDQEFPLLSHQRLAKQVIAEYGQEAIRVFEHDGVAGSDDFAAKLLHDSGVKIALFDSAGRGLTRQHVPRRMQRMARQALHSGEVVFPLRGTRNALASRVKGGRGQDYIVVISLANRPHGRPLIDWITHGLLGWPLFIFLAITALVCFGLARSLTAPIGRLRQVTQQFAGGDLGARIGDQVTGHDEVAALARDFDDMAGKIEDLIGAQKRLLRDISHELRSPLARQAIAVELARQQGNSEAQHKALARIELEAQRMNTMIGQLLNLTRLENSGYEIPFQSFDLSQLVRDLVQDVRFEAQTRQCEVVCNAPEVAIYSGSRELLAQALENVLRNALKYTPDNSVVEVNLTERGGTFTLQVIDQGGGVPDELLGKLFEPFYRVGDARDRQSGGSGIGLAIAQRAIKVHGGTIVASNRAEGGLMVEIIL